MTTGTLIIERALQKIGSASAVSPPDPSSVQTAFESLNGMIAMWSAKGIDIGAVALTVPGDDLGENAASTNGVIYNLAVYMAPDFDNGKVVVTPELRSLAAKEMGNIKALYQTFTIPKKVISSTTPRGQGNPTWRWGDAFFPEGSEIGN